jgi:phosphohistidine phosphatase
VKKLFLIRHAKSSWANAALSDFERPLNDRGNKDAPFMAQKLAEAGARPDTVLSSPAKRAAKTAVIMAGGVGFAKDLIVYDQDIYSGSLQGLYTILHRLDDAGMELFFVGHNPDITDLAESLTGEHIGNIPTCGVVALECPIDRWSDLVPACGKLLFFDYPKRYQERR